MITDVVLSRLYRQRQTTGCLYVFDGDRSVANVKTLELPWLNNQRKISCIPADTYEAELITSPTKNAAVDHKIYLIKNVPNRDAIEVHIGNFASGQKVDTEGCILVGLRHTDMNKDGELDVEASTEAMKLLLAVLPTKFKIHIF